MIQLHTLGTVGLRQRGIEVRSVLSQPRRLALLVYLATDDPTGFQPRNRLLTLFWPDSDEEKGRLALRQALHHLRRSLGEGAITGRGEAEVGVDRAVLWTDAVAFEEALTRGALAEALDLYRGEFMPGFFPDVGVDVERFLEERRDRYRRAAVKAAWTLASQEEARGELRAAAARGRLALSLDPHDEGTLRRLTDLLERSGQREEAAAVFDEYVRRLETDLELEPSLDVRLLGDALRSAASSPPTAALGSPDTGRDSHEHLEVATDSRTDGRVRRAILVAAVVVSVAALTALRASDRRASPVGGSASVPATTDRSWAATPEVAAVAVLPFLNMSGDPSNEFFSDGVAEEVSFALSRVPGLRVVGRTSVSTFKGKNAGVDSIGRALGVSYVLEGSVRMTGERVRIVAQLLDASSGLHLWSEVYEGEASDALGVQDRIARAVVEELEPRFTGGVAPRPATTRETRDPEAHASLLRGLKALYSGTIGDYARAETFFARAIELDPGYGRAYAGLAGVQAIYAYLGEVPPREGFERATALAERAIELDPRVSDSHAVLGRVAQNYLWDMEVADGHFRRAIELNPGRETWYRQRALLLAYVGRPREAVAHALRAVEIDPLATGAHRHLGMVYFLTGDYDRAIESYEDALALAPGHDVTLMYLAQALSMTGRHEEAITVAREALTYDPNAQLVQANTAWVLARGGEAEASRALLARLEAGPRPSPYLLALVHTGLGDVDEAFALLEQSVDRHEPFAVELSAFPGFDLLRADPRLDLLLERIARPGAGSPGTPR